MILLTNTEEIQEEYKYLRTNKRLLDAVIDKACLRAKFTNLVRYIVNNIRTSDLDIDKKNLKWYFDAETAVMYNYDYFRVTMRCVTGSDTYKFVYYYITEDEGDDKVRKRVEERDYFKAIRNNNVETSQTHIDVNDNSIMKRYKEDIDKVKTKIKEFQAILKAFNNSDNDKKLEIIKKFNNNISPLDISAYSIKTYNDLMSNTFRSIESNKLDDSIYLNNLDKNIITRRLNLHIHNIRNIFIAYMYSDFNNNIRENMIKQLHESGIESIIEGVELNSNDNLAGLGGEPDLFTTENIKFEVVIRKCYSNLKRADDLYYALRKILKFAHDLMKIEDKVTFNKFLKMLHVTGITYEEFKQLANTPLNEGNYGGLGGHWEKFIKGETVPKVFEAKIRHISWDKDMYSPTGYRQVICNVEIDEEVINNLKSVSAYINDSWAKTEHLYISNIKGDFPDQKVKFKIITSVNDNVKKIDGRKLRWLTTVYNRQYARYDDKKLLRLTYTETDLNNEDFTDDELVTIKEKDERQ